MKQIKLTVQPRDKTGRGPAKRERASGSIPAVLYGPSGVRNLSVSYSSFQRLWREISGQTALIEVTPDNEQPVLSIIQEIQRDARTDAFTHIDFREVSADHEITTHIAVHVHGEPIGVKMEGGLMDVVLHEIEVRALPQNLPSMIEIDVTNLKSGHSIHVADLEKLEGVTYLIDKDQPIVSVVEPRGPSADEEADEAAAEQEEETASEESASEEEDKD